jgi:hypothetical protein
MDYQLNVITAGSLAGINDGFGAAGSSIALCNFTPDLQITTQ